MARVVRSDDVAPQPWANGGGTTRELLVADDGSWRISLADVAATGPFSTYAGRRRLLTVVEARCSSCSSPGVARRRAAAPLRLLRRRRRRGAAARGPGARAQRDRGPAVSPHVTVLELGRGSALPLADDQAAYVLTGPDARSLVVGPGEVAGRCTVAVVTLDRG